MKLQNTLGLLAFAGIALGACSGNNSNNPAQILLLNELEYVVVEAGTLTTSPTQIQGSGKVVFNTPLSGVKTNNSYALQLKLEDGGSMTLVANCDNKLGGGLNLVLSRSGTALKLTMKSGANASSEITLAGADASGALTLQIDVHNSETPAHVLVWTGSDFAEGSAVLNSEDTGNEAPGNGTGSLWGLELNKATVTGASASTPKFSE